MAKAAHNQKAGILGIITILVTQVFLHVQLKKEQKAMVEMRVRQLAQGQEEVEVVIMAVVAVQTLEVGAEDQHFLIQN